jgi:hypothetical protein
MHMNSSILYCELVAVWLFDMIIRSLLARSTGYYEKGGWLPYCPASMPLPQSQRAGKHGPGRCVFAIRTQYCFGAAAARISFWPTAPLDHIEAANRSALKPQLGFAFSRRRIPEELIAWRDGMHYTVPALTAIDLATFACSDAIDIALRVRAATLANMYEALRLTPHRAGNRERLKLLIDSRGEPWSAAERWVTGCCVLRGSKAGSRICPC